MSVCKNIENIKSEIKKTAKEFLLYNDNVKIIAVSKNQPVEKIEEAIRCGQIDFAENYIQEAEEKWVELKQKYPQVRLHLIGHLQSNKAKKALELFDVIHSLDSVSLAKKISNIIVENNIQNKTFLVQVLLDENSDTKYGLPAKDIPKMLEECKNLGLQVKGLMVVAPLSNNPTVQEIPLGAYFAFTKHLSDKYGFKEISMGMSGDYKSALRFGKHNAKDWNIYIW